MYGDRLVEAISEIIKLKEDVAELKQMVLGMQKTIALSLEK